MDLGPPEPAPPLAGEPGAAPPPDDPAPAATESTPRAPRIWPVLVVLAVLFVGSVAGATVAFLDDDAASGAWHLAGRGRGGPGAERDVVAARAGADDGTWRTVVHDAGVDRVVPMGARWSDHWALSVDLGGGRHLLEWLRGEEQGVVLVEGDGRDATLLLRSTGDVAVHHDPETGRVVVRDQYQQQGTCWWLDGDRLLPMGHDHVCVVLPDGRAATLRREHREWTVRELDGTRGASFPAAGDPPTGFGDEVASGADFLVVGGAVLVQPEDDLVELYDLDSGEEVASVRAERRVRVLDVDADAGAALVASDDGLGEIAVRLLDDDGTDELIASAASVDALVLDRGVAAVALQGPDDGEVLRFADGEAMTVADGTRVALVGRVDGGGSFVARTGDDLDAIVLVDEVGAVDDVPLDGERDVHWWRIDGDLVAASQEAEPEDDEEEDEHGPSADLVRLSGPGPSVLGAARREGLLIIDVAPDGSMLLVETVFVPDEEDDERTVRRDQIVLLSADGERHQLGVADDVERPRRDGSGAWAYGLVDRPGPDLTDVLVDDAGAVRRRLVGEHLLPEVGGRATWSRTAGSTGDAHRPLVEAWVDEVLEACLDDGLVVLEDGDGANGVIEDAGFEVCIDVPVGAERVDLRVRAGVDTVLYLDDEWWSDDEEGLDPRLEGDVEPGVHRVSIEPWDFVPDDAVARVELTYAVDGRADPPPAVEVIDEPDPFPPSGGDDFTDAFGDVDGLEGEALEAGMRAGMRYALEQEGVFGPETVDCIVDGVFDRWTAEEILALVEDAAFEGEFADGIVEIVFACASDDELFGPGFGADPFSAPPTTFGDGER